jgi:hypothetical protein
MPKTCGSSTSNEGEKRSSTVDDQDFEFRVPTEKRAARPFEPPPWEKSAFDELEKRRQEPGPEEEARGIAESETIAADAVPAAAGAKAEPDFVHTSGDVVSTGGGIPESKVVEMMAGLAAEEPRPHESYWSVALAVSLVLVAIGAVLLIWGVAALVSSSTTGWIGQLTGTGLGLFGTFFIGMGLWLLYRTLRQRGVL